MQDPSLLDECELSEELKKVLLENIKQKLTQQAVKIRADIEVRNSSLNKHCLSSAVVVAHGEISTVFQVIHACDSIPGRLNVFMIILI